MISQIVDPPERLREAAQELAEKIAKNSPAAMARHEAGAVGRARAGPHRRLPGRRRGAGLDVGPPRPGGGPARLRREARAGWSRDRPVTTPRDARATCSDASATDATASDAVLRPRRRRRRRTRAPRSRRPGRRPWPRALGRRRASSPGDAGRRSMLPNGADVVATLFGVWRAGGVYVPLNPRLDRREVEHVLEPVDPRRSSPRRTRRPLSAAPASSSTPAPRRVGRADGADASTPDVALVQFTSGTTGRPKPVLLTPLGRARRCSTACIGTLRRRPATTARRAERRRCRTSSRCRCRCGPGIYHVLFAFRVGAPVVVMDGFDPASSPTLVAPLRDPLDRAAAGGDGDAVRRRARSPTSRRCGTSAASPRRCRRSRPAGSATASASPCSTATARPRSAARSSAGARADSRGARRRQARRRSAVPHAGSRSRRRRRADEPASCWVRTPALSGGYADGADLGRPAQPPTAGSAPATSAASTTTASCGSRAGCRDMINRGGLKVFPAEVEEVLRLSPGGRRRRRGRRARRPARRGAVGVRRAGRPGRPRPPTRPRRRCAASTSRPTRCRCASSPSTRSPATRSARCSPPISWHWPEASPKPERSSWPRRQPATATTAVPSRSGTRHVVDHSRPNHRRIAGRAELGLLGGAARRRPPRTCPSGAWPGRKVTSTLATSSLPNSR